MAYASMTFWLLVIVLTAWGVHHLWSGMIKPRVVNSILLPGTLIAQLGRVLALLVTGGTVNNTTLIKDDETGEPSAEPDPKPKIPVVGPVLVGLLPLAACGALLAVTAGFWGRPIIEPVATASPAAVSPSLPTTLHGGFDTVRHAISLVEATLGAILDAEWRDWTTWAFLYLAICLTVRMAPLPGNLRGSLGAILLVGVVAALVGTVAGADPAAYDTAWSILRFAVGVLLLLLIVSLFVRGCVSVVRIVSTGK